MLKGIITIFVCIATAYAQAPVKVIYDTDDRYEYFQVSPMLQRIAQSTAAMIGPELMDRSGPVVKFYGDSLFETPIMAGNLPLCRNERFSEQLSVAMCSGFLISPDTLVTAGHCIVDQEDCRQNYWVFNFKNTSPAQTESTVSSQDVYRCKTILKRALTRDQTGAIDFAVIKLDRPNPTGGLKILNRRLSLNEEVTMLGHPTGMPLKITTNGKIKQVSQNGYLTDLDAFGGNSGSVVIHSKTGEVVGILSSGQDDYVADHAKKCARPNLMSSKDSAEYVSAITQLGAIAP